MQFRSIAGCVAALACTGASMAAIGADIVYTSVTGVTTYGR
jgi:hypothetical protein